MDRLKCFLTAILAVLLTGCGQTVVETLHVPESPGYNAPGSGKTIVILPFADYSEGNLQSAQRRNMRITESFTDNLTAVGFGLPIQEDVFDYLVDQKVIQVAAYHTADTESLDVELENDWSDIMKGEIQRYKAQVEAEAGNSANPGTHGLTPKMVAKIGRHFNADYIVRGRILEFKTRDEASWAPWKKGLLPFINGGASRILGGFASSDTYDERNEALTGMLIAGRLGYTSGSWPWDKVESVLGRTGQDANTVFWGAAGYGLGKVSHSSGRIDQAVVQMRVWVQEAATGNVIWTNRIRVQVAPESFFSDKQYDTLFNKAIEKGVSTLVSNFISQATL